MPFRRTASVLLAIWVVVVLAITLSPNHIDRGAKGLIGRFFSALHRHGILEGFGYNQLEFVANIFMLVPLGLLATLILGNRRWWVGVAAGFLLSAIVESAQALFLPGRTATLQDVVANTLGALLGSSIAVLAHSIHRYVERSAKLTRLHALGQDVPQRWWQRR